MKLPAKVSLSEFKKDPITYVHELSKADAIGLAQYLDFNYHTDNVSVVEDEVYDILKDSIHKRWPTDPYLKTVGHAVKSNGRALAVRLPNAMPSMDKLKPHTKQLEAFLADGKEYVISDKLDGISLQLEYKNGVLVKCYTRGDGYEGQDVSNVIPALKCPKRVPVKELQVRCEFIIKRKGFNAFSKENGGKYVTGRNMGGGLLTHNNPTAQVKAFEVVAYEILKGPDAGAPIKKQFDTLQRLKFNTVKHKVVRALTSQKLEELLEEFKKTTEYEIDGIIVDKNVPYNPTGANPKHAKAFKVNSFEKSKVVTVKAVIYRRSRLARLVPRVLIDPIALGGVTVEYFTGHSFFYIQHGYTYQAYKAAQKQGTTLRTMPINAGAVIRVVRSGDVIPYIVSVEKPSRTPAKPTVEYKMGPNNVHAIATGALTDEDEVKTITHFFSALKIEGLKSGVITKLYDAGYTTVGDILFITLEQLIAIDGIQSKMANNIVKNIDIGLSKATFSTIGYASQQYDEAIGTRKLQAVVDMYPDFIDRATKQPVRALTTLLEKVPGIKTQAQQIAEGTKRFIKWLDETGLELGPEEKRQPSGSKLSGISVLFTGVRDADLLESILSNGGKTAGSVKTASVLITKPGTSNNKTEYANANRIPVLTIAEFKQKYKL
jgi:NAD-dependent DNA ligase